MTYAEGTVESDQPRELITISINDGVTTYRHTSASRDISYGGNTYTAIACERSDIAVITAEQEAELVLTLPIDHPLSSRYPAQAAPPMKITVTVTRLMGADALVLWVGDITSMSVDRGEAKFRVPSRAGQWLLRVLPPFTLSDTCVHRIYDTSCGVNRNGAGPLLLAHKRTCTVLAINGRDVRVDLDDTNRNVDWAGELVHTDSGERRAVIAQADEDPGVNAIAVLTLSLSIPEMTVGDSVDIYAACNYDMDTCVNRFDARQSFLGWPLKPAIDFFSPVGGGVEPGE